MVSFLLLCSKYRQIAVKEMPSLLNYLSLHFFRNATTDWSHGIIISQDLLSGVSCKKTKRGKAKPHPTCGYFPDSSCTWPQNRQELFDQTCVHCRLLYKMTISPLNQIKMSCNKCLLWWVRVFRIWNRLLSSWFSHNRSEGWIDRALFKLQRL